MGTDIMHHFLESIADLNFLGYDLRLEETSQLRITPILPSEIRAEKIKEALELYEAAITKYPDYNHQPSGILDMLNMLKGKTKDVDFILDKDLYDIFWEDRHELMKKFKNTECEKSYLLSIDTPNLVS